MRSRPLVVGARHEDPLSLLHEDPSDRDDDGDDAEHASRRCKPPLWVAPGRQLHEADQAHDRNDDNDAE